MSGQVIPPVPSQGAPSGGSAKQGSDTARPVSDGARGSAPSGPVGPSSSSLSTTWSRSLVANVLRDDIEALKGVAQAVAAVAADIPRVMDVDPSIVWGAEWLDASAIVFQLQALAAGIERIVSALAAVKGYRGPISSSGIPGDAIDHHPTCQCFDCVRAGTAPGVPVPAAPGAGWGIDPPYRYPPTSWSTPFDPLRGSRERPFA